MIVVKLQGGLGNQLFQYACGFALAKQLSKKLVFDFSFFSKASESHTPRKLELHKLVVIPDCIYHTPQPRFYSRSFKAEIKYLIHNISGRKPFWAYNNDLKLPDRSNKNIYLDGYWQSEKYFKFFRKELITQIKPQQALSKEANNQLQLIHNYTSVAVHVRRGDYVSNPRYLKKYGVCSLSYYKEAISRISDILNKPTFFFFSDDNKWVLDNFDINNNFFIVENTSEAWEDLWLMSKCNHQIVANSTFSWWGAWLNINLDKIIIAPKHWYNDPVLNEERKNLVPEEWLRI